MKILTPIDGGYRVKETPTHYIDVMRMLFSWRIVTSRKDSPGWPERGWCYNGTGYPALIAACLAANAWDGADGTEPVGWNKNVQTGEWREPAREARASEHKASLL